MINFIEPGCSGQADGKEEQQHVDAIQAENLIRRVMGITSVNDGSHHADGAYISNPTSLPEYR